MVPVERDDDIPLRLKQAGFIGPSIPAHFLLDHARPVDARELGRAVRGIVVDDYYLVN